MIDKPVDPPAKHKLYLHQFDVPSAYLNSDLHDNVQQQQQQKLTKLNTNLRIGHSSTCRHDISQSFVKLP
ncbi:unnamed protein product [Ceratitis capitata]|uniref:(Mediterranean fruit fly) hypothetical protein n=1 Tax=Ceratitis capitata TaxID=7213 RepID=A0A811UQA8_CERCA|nr:unnamed protein product [Ceratitis capitata]